MAMTQIEFSLPMYFNAKDGEEKKPIPPKLIATFQEQLITVAGGATWKEEFNGAWKDEKAGIIYKDIVTKYEVGIEIDSLKKIYSILKAARFAFEQEDVYFHSTVKTGFISDISLCYIPTAPTFTRPRGVLVEMPNRTSGINGLILPMTEAGFQTLDDLFNKSVSPDLLAGEDSPFLSLRFKDGDPDEQIKWLKGQCSEIVVYGDIEMLENDAEIDVAYMGDFA